MRIALTGKMRSGKDTVCELLNEIDSFRRIAFGDKIRGVCEELYPELVSTPEKPRFLYQGIGQDLRKYDKGVWLKYLLRQVEAMPTETNIVVTDMRQPNEYEALRAEGFTIVRVEADLETRILRMIAAGDNTKVADLYHETELMVEEFRVQYEIPNNSTLDYLRDEVVVMHRFLCERGHG